jgi:hypothetical protein
MRLFGRNSPDANTLTLGAAMQAIIGQATVSTEQAEAANIELEAAGIKGAMLITEAAFNDLDSKAGRVDAAEASVKGYTDALAAAGAADMAALVAERNALKVKADKFDAKPGASHTTPALPTGTTDLEKGEPDANQKAIDDMPHNQAVASNPLFGPRITD